MKSFRKRKFFSFFITILSSTSLFLGTFSTAYAQPSEKDARVEANQQVAVESNNIAGWPQGPTVSAKSAILIEANTGTVLYAKNIHEKLYPASITKILTAYIARQKSGLEEEVVYSSKAVNSINWLEDSNIGIKAGETLTMEQSLYSLLVGSANECGNAIGEHISGSMEAFVELMNQTASEIGCTDSHFVTTNGIHDEQHYTSAHDMALIAQHFFDDELLCKMSSQRSYTLPASSTLSQELTATCKNQLLPERKYEYQYLVGSKTGYTDIARQNLVSCAEKDGLKLICVVMQDEAPMQYTDTIDLFNYGFSNFKAVNVSQNDTTYNVRSNNFFMTESDIFGDSNPILSIDEDAYIVLPADAAFEDLTSRLSYADLMEGQAAVVYYSFQDQSVGSAAILFSEHTSTFDFNAEPETSSESTAESESERSDSDIVSAQAAKPVLNSKNIVFLNVKKILIGVGILAAAAVLGVVIFSILKNRRLSRRRRAIMKRRRSKKNEIIDFDRYIDRP